MKFTFTESVKLATKGFKPQDISELSLLDEDKFSKEDILSLVSNGYSKTDVKKLVETFTVDKSEDDQKDTSDENESHTDEDSTNEDKKESDTSKESDKEETGDIDYKELYEKEKKLREDLQHGNASKNSGTKNDTRTSEQVAIDIANSILE